LNIIVDLILFLIFIKKKDSKLIKELLHKKWFVKFVHTLYASNVCLFLYIDAKEDAIDAIANIFNLAVLQYLFK